MENIEHEPSHEWDGLIEYLKAKKRYGKDLARIAMELPPEGLEYPSCSSLRDRFLYKE